MKQSEKRFALITGASQGLGRAFAYELARRGINLILTSLPGEGLSQTADELKVQFEVEIVIFETDLSVNHNVIELAYQVNEKYELYMLINNAGLGGSKRFLDASTEYINTILQLNVVATSLLTRLLLPNLIRMRYAYILNVSSMAAFSPIGYKTVYPASKSFVHSFSRGLHQELKDTGVFVSVVNPGAMKTSPEITSRIENQGILGRLTLLDPAKVALKCINGLLKKDSVIMVNSFSWLMLTLLPIWIKLPLMTNIIRRELK